MGRFYAAAIEDFAVDYDVIFGPAYKGIPLVSTTVVALHDVHGKSVPYAFNRKEGASLPLLMAQKKTRLCMASSDIPWALKL